METIVKVIDNRGEINYDERFLSADDVVLAFSGHCYESGWEFRGCLEFPKYNGVFVLINCYDENDQLVDQVVVDANDLDRKLEELEGVAKVVLSNEFDADEDQYFLGGLVSS